MRYLFILFFIITIGCDHKNDAKENDSLSFYFVKADDTSLSREERIVFNRKALTLLLQQKQDSLLVRNLFIVAGRYYNLGDLEAYRTTSLLIEEKACQAKDNKGMAKIRAYLGDYYKNKAIVDSAYLYYTKAKKIYNILKDQRNVGTMHFKIAYLYYKEGDFARSRISAFKALSHFRDIKNNNKELYEIYNLLGVLSNEEKEYDIAIKYHRKALNLTIGNLSNFKPFSLNNLGVVYRNQNKNGEAGYYFQTALKNKILEKKELSLYAILLDNLAYSQFKIKDFSQLPDLFYKALFIRDSLQKTSGIIINKLHLSEYYQQQKNTITAVKFAQEAYDLATVKGIDATDILLCLKQLLLVDSGKRTFYLSEYVKIIDSIQFAKQKLPTKIVRAAFDAEELTINKIQLEKDNKNLVILFLSIAFALIILFILFLLRYQQAKYNEYKLREKQQNLYAQFYESNEEIYRLMLSQSDKMNEETDVNKQNISEELNSNFLEKLLKVRHGLDLFNYKKDKESIRKRALLIRELKKLEDNIVGVLTNLLTKKETNNSFIVLLEQLVYKENLLDISFDIADIEWQKIDTIIKINLYKIIEESLNNIYQHAIAQELYGGIAVHGNNLKLTIIDDGIGFDLDRISEGQGLKNMRFRTENMGGTFTISSSKDKGTKVEVIIPMVLKS